MASKPNLRKIILNALAPRGELEFGDLVTACPECTWNQIFAEVQRLSRRGELQITKQSFFYFTVKKSRDEAPTSNRVGEDTIRRRHRVVTSP